MAIRFLNPPSGATSVSSSFQDFKEAPYADMAMKAFRDAFAPSTATSFNSALQQVGGARAQQGYFRGARGAINRLLNPRIGFNLGEQINQGLADAQRSALSNAIALGRGAGARGFSSLGSGSVNQGLGALGRAIMAEHIRLPGQLGLQRDILRHDALVSGAGQALGMMQGMAGADLSQRQLALGLRNQDIQQRIAAQQAAAQLLSTAFPLSTENFSYQIDPVVARSKYYAGPPYRTIGGPASRRFGDLIFEKGIR